MIVKVDATVDGKQVKIGARVKREFLNSQKNCDMIFKNLSLLFYKKVTAK